MVLVRGFRVVGEAIKLPRRYSPRERAWDDVSRTCEGDGEGNDRWQPENSFLRGLGVRKDCSCGAESRASAFAGRRLDGPQGTI